MGKPGFSFNMKKTILLLILAMSFGFVVSHVLFEDRIHSLAYPMWLELMVEFFVFITLSLPFFYFMVYKDLQQKRKEDEILLDEYATYKMILEHSPSAAFIYGDSGFIYISPTFCSTLGFEQDEVLGKTFSEIPFLNKQTVQLLTENRKKRAINDDVPQSYNIPAIRKDGTDIVIELRPTWSLFKGNPVTIGTLVDVTEKVLIGKQKKENENKYRSLFEHNMDAAFIIDNKGIVIEANSRALVMTGQEMDEIQGKSFMEFIASSDLEIASDKFKYVLQGQALHHEFNVVIKEKKYLYDVSVVPIIVEDDIKGIFCLARDVTEQRKSNELIKWLAYHDSMTSLPNRHYFIDQLELKMKYCDSHNDSLALLYLDLDRVKIINDNLGHQIGDMYLKEASVRLKNYVKGKGLISRFGGDEFALLLPSVTKETADSMAQEILQIFSEPFVLGGQIVPGNTSIGIAIYPGGARDVQALLREADKALYVVKKSGGGNYRIYEDTMERANSYRFALQSDFQRALHDEEFYLVYQPKVNATTGHISGVEALLRWNKNNQEMISPADFIPLAEETGFIVPLGEWVLRKACEQNKKWQDAGFAPIRVAVNVSAVQFQRSKLDEVVERILAETGLDPQWLEVEITEGTLMEQDEFTIRSITRLKELGVIIALDDFGTGYSSMQYLKQFRLHSLKVDRSFIQDLHEHHDRAAITEAITQLAHGLGMIVVAEGVEKDEELEFIKSIGADEIQGYYISRPLSKIDFESYLESGSKVS
jgi:diguanylate cyclase